MLFSLFIHLMKNIVGSEDRKVEAHDSLFLGTTFKICVRLWGKKSALFLLIMGENRRARACACFMWVADIAHIGTADCARTKGKRSARTATSNRLPHSLRTNSPHNAFADREASCVSPPTTSANDVSLDSSSSETYWQNCKPFNVVNSELSSWKQSCTGVRHFGSNRLA